MLEIAGIGFALLLPSFSLFLCFLFFAYNPREWRKVFPLYVYVLFIIGYCIEANGENDMSSYFRQITNMEGLTLKESIQFQNDTLFVKDFFFWLSAQLKMPHLMTGLPVTLVVGTASYIACDYAEGSESKNYLWIILLIVLLQAPLFALANNIRNVSAFAIAVLAAYRDLKQGKRNLVTVLLYILPIFIHTTGIILVAVRFFIPVFKKYRLVALVLVFALPAIIKFAYSNINLLPLSGALGFIIRKLVYSANNYLAGQSAYAQRISASIGATVKRYVSFSWLIFISVVILKQVNDEKNNGFKIYTYLLAVLALSCVAFNTPAYWRFSTALLVASPPVYCDIFLGKYSLRRGRQIYIVVLLCYTLVDVVFYIDSFLDNAVISYFFENLLLENAYTLIYHIVRII